MIHIKTIWKDTRLYYNLSDVLKIQKHLAYKYDNQEKKKFLTEIQRLVNSSDRYIQEFFFYIDKELFISVDIFQFLADDFLKEFDNIFSILTYWLEKRWEGVVVDV